MTTIKSSITILFFLFSFTVFAQNKETRNVGDFDQITMGVAGKVYIKQGNVNEVILEGDDSVLEEIVTEVRGGRLVIKNKRDGWSWNFWGSSKSSRVEVYITIKELKGAAVSGSGEIIGESTFKTRDFEADLSGSGSMEIEIDAQYTSTKISGSGRIIIGGKTEQAKLRISGSGRYAGQELAAEDYEISISGSGRSNIQVSGDLDVRISGSGSVYYDGEPIMINKKIGGSGRVRKAN
ncbi:MAG: hypothetical protein ACJAXX_002426 [Roseivirga sp.]|jgi:hypothetical protein